VRVRTVIALARESVQDFFADKGLRVAAALSYYTLFSLAPFLLLIISVAGVLFDPVSVRASILEQTNTLVGTDAAQAVESILTTAQPQHVGVLATVIGVVALLLGATGLIGQLKDALNTAWNVQPVKRGFIGVIRSRLLSLGILIGVLFLLIVSLLVSALLATFQEYLRNTLPFAPVLLHILSYLVSVVVFTILFAGSFKFLPDRHIAWKYVWVGAFVTAILFSIGKELIGIYLGNSAIASRFGAAASVIALLVWVYYAAAIFLLGAEFTQVYAKLRHGSTHKTTQHS
jgi:membrane protein